MNISRIDCKKIAAIVGCMMIAISVMATCALPYAAAEQAEAEHTASTKKIEQFIEEKRERSQIPGMSVVIVEKGKTVFEKGFGYADLDSKKPVTEHTLFELGSTTKAFTGLAILQLEKAGLINRTDDVRKYLPWFTMNNGGKPAAITICQLLYHTSGISARTIALIPEDDTDRALEKTVRMLLGQELDRKPGSSHEYATINYDVLGLVIEQVTKQSYETYIKQHVLEPLGMTASFVGIQPVLPSEMATGYRVGFLKPRSYFPPIYRGNNPAGYLVSNSIDIAKWMNAQLGYGLNEQVSKELVQESQKPDLSVDPIDDTYYASGWSIGEDQKLIMHAGANPAFSSYIILQQDRQLGVAVMANRMSDATAAIGQSVLTLWKGENLSDTVPNDRMQALDQAAVSVVGITGGLALLGWLAGGRLAWNIAKRKRVLVSLGVMRLIGFVALLLVCAGGICLVLALPKLFLGGMPWSFIAVWSPPTILLAAYCLAAMFAGWFVYGALKIVTKKTE
ncbi:serine hydrolase domain-containing protein [Paenibacillus alvei]|uniref:serine hydrolase domain-containing protein n=1 Tax=Paenibacillus alvei TaxID=44250 RepID=UPI001F504A57|nr:serine hydrolase domain-containing protein [Paenibacillus alvei]MCY9582914.1 beta-lactamase family protein [Paenibacillus alvei]MCY9588100.1 beta-lactamase family protein [Paenibacillus alvei]